MYSEKQQKEVIYNIEPSDKLAEIRHSYTNETTQCRFSNGDMMQNAERAEAATTSEPNHTGLPNRLKTGLETLSGYDLSSVRVHCNSHKPRQIGALAYTQGTNIHIGPGQQRHLPHEGWHAVQQMQGRVKPTLQMNGGVNINDDMRLEDETDLMGIKAAQIKLKEKNLPADKSTSNKNISDSFQFMDNRPEVVVQRMLQEKANRNLQAKPTTQLQTMANSISQAKKVVQLKTIVANHSSQQNKNGEVKQLVREIDHVSEDISGVCGYMALHAAFTSLKADYNDGKDWAQFKEENPTIIKNDATAICSIEELLEVINYYEFEGVVHEFNDGPELVTALEETGDNPVLIGHTLLGIPQRGPDEEKTEGDRAHWSVISKLKEGIITMWDNWCDGGKGVRDKPYTIKAKELADKSLVLEGQTHEFSLLSESEEKRSKELDIHGRLVEVKLKKEK